MAPRNSKPGYSGGALRRHSLHTANYSLRCYLSVSETSITLNFFSRAIGVLTPYYVVDDDDDDDDDDN